MLTSLNKNIQKFVTIPTILVFQKKTLVNLVISHYNTLLYLNTMQMYNRTDVNNPVQTLPSDNEAKCRKSG